MCPDKPALYEMVIATCNANRWTVTGYDGAQFGGTAETRYAGIIAVRGDIRIRLEWHRYGPCGGELGEWSKRRAEISVRHPDHDPADYTAVHPSRWTRRATADAPRRWQLTSAFAVMRLASRTDGALAETILAMAARHTTLPLALRQCTFVD